nr:AAA family ATPase [Pseudactinotalea suaedae]
MQMRYVLGAPGVGKSTVLPLLTERLPGWVVLDWDWLMPAAMGLAGRPVREHQELWQPYAELVRSVLSGLGSVPVLLATVCTPQELDPGQGWPTGEWLLLDCDDEERVRRLSSRGGPEAGVLAALADAAEYRALGLPCIDTGRRDVAEVLDAVAVWARPQTMPADRA